MVVRKVGRLVLKSCLHSKTWFSLNLQINRSQSFLKIFNTLCEISWNQVNMAYCCGCYGFWVALENRKNKREMLKLPTTNHPSFIATTWILWLKTFCLYSCLYTYLNFVSLAFPVWTTCLRTFFFRDLEEVLASLCITVFQKEVNLYIPCILKNSAVTFTSHMWW